MIILSCEKPAEEPAKVVGYFKNISLSKNTDITLVQGATNSVLSTTLDDAEYSVSDETLYISGLGTITIAVSDLEQINMTSGKLLNTGTVVLPHLYLSMTNGSSNLTNFHISGTFEGHFTSTGNYKFSGSAGYCHLATINAAVFNSPDFVCDSLTYIGSLSNVDSKVHVTQKLIFILGIGNLYYNGYPTVIDTNYTGPGQLIHL